MAQVGQKGGPKMHDPALESTHPYCVLMISVLPLRGGRRVAAVHAAEPLLQLRGQGVRLLRRRRQQLPGKRERDIDE